MSSSSPPRPKVRVQLTNRWATFRCSPDLKEELRPIYAYEHPRARFIASYRSGDWDGLVSLMQRGRVGAGLFLEREKELRARFRPIVEDLREAPKFRALPFDEKVRPFQREAIEAMVAAARTGGLILSATGSGKTWTAAEFFRRLDGSALFVVDELALLEQARAELSTALGEEVGVVGKSKFDPRRVTVATIQTLDRHREDPAYRPWFRDLSVAVIDEVHLAVNDRSAAVVKKLRPLAVYGLTATLQLEKPQVRFPVIALTGPVLFEYPIDRGIREGYLSEAVVVSVRFLDPLRGRAPGYFSERVDEYGDRIWVADGSKPAEYRYHVELNRARNDLVEQVAREGVRRGMRVVVLAEHHAHIRALHRRFKDVEHALASGHVKAADRTDAMRAMDRGTLPLIVASRVFSKGVNIRSLDLIVDATGMPGRNGALQRFGRGTRKAEGKRGLVYVSVSDAGSPYEDASRARLKALRETECPIVEVDWKAGTAPKIFDAAEKRLKAEVRERGEAREPDLAPWAASYMRRRAGRRS